MSGLPANNTPEKPIDLSFVGGLQDLLRRHGWEKSTSTPDFVLADFLCSCLNAFASAAQKRDDWCVVKNTPAWHAEPAIPIVGVGTPLPPATEEPDSICKPEGHDFKVLRNRFDALCAMLYCTRCGATKEIRFG